MKNDFTIRALHDLIDVSRDGERGFQICAEHAQSVHLRQLLHEHAGDCAEAITELQALVRQLGGDPQRTGSRAAAVRRAWIGLGAALASGDDAALLAECEHAEDCALEVYRNALDDHLPDFVRAAVLRQFEAVMGRHDQLRGLRNQYLHRPVAVGASARG